MVRKRPASEREILALSQLKLASQLGQAVLGEVVKQPIGESAYRECLIGMLVLAIKHGDCLDWSIENGNRPSMMVMMRVMIELIINLDYIKEVTDFREFRSLLLLLENQERHLAMLQSPNSPVASEPHPLHQDLVDKLEEEKREIISKLEKLPKAPDDPVRWTLQPAIKGVSPKLEGVSVWKRAKIGKWQGFYEFAYQAGSGYVHSDGYAFWELKAGIKSGTYQIARYCANFVMAIIEAIIEDWPNIGQVPDVVKLWNQYGENMTDA